MLGGQLAIFLVILASNQRLTTTAYLEQIFGLLMSHLYESCPLYVNYIYMLCLLVHRLIYSLS